MAHECCSLVRQAILPAAAFRGGSLVIDDYGRSSLRGITASGTWRRDRGPNASKPRHRAQQNQLVLIRSLAEEDPLDFIHKGRLPGAAVASPAIDLAKPYEQAHILIRKIRPRRNNDIPDAIGVRHELDHAILRKVGNL